MTSTFDDDERSVSGSRPIDLFRITTPTVTYYLTSYVTDVTYGGNVYTATTMSRGNQQVAQDLTGRELIVYLPITHPLVRRYAAFGIPEHDVVVTQYRLQSRSGVAIQQHSGFAQSMSMDLHTASIRVPSVTDDAMKIMLPVIAAQMTCNHVLGDRQCQVDLEHLTAQTEITVITGSAITVAVPLVGNDYQFGNVTHFATGQTRMVIAQSDATLTLNAPFVGGVVGDGVDIEPGCDHAVLTCRDKFANVINFGGHPNMDGRVNFFAPGGLGRVEQA